MIVALLTVALQFSPVQELSPLFEGTGSYTRPVSSVPLAQKYFDQGLNMLFAFHHGESKRSFRSAIAADPDCPMAYWGLAMANGPHVNNMAVAPEEEKEAYDAIQKAVSLIAKAKPADQVLIRATRVRFAQPQPADRTPLNRAYAAKMRSAWRANPNDADAACFFAESMMNLRPWDYWTADGTPYPGTLDFVAAIEKAMTIEPNHPLALHLYIHAVEASNHPEKARAAADRLREVQPGLGHNVHMPSHIDVRVGDWQKAIDSNAKAMTVDSRYRAEHTPAPVYRFYMAHNNHMLAFAAMMIGQSKRAEEAVDAMVAAVPEDAQIAMAPVIDGLFAMPMEVRVRFGKWDEVLAMPLPLDRFPLSKAMAHCSRAIAFAAKGMPKEARGEQAEFYSARKALPDGYAFGQNKGADILMVATYLMNGEILVSEGKVDSAISTLRTGVALEDKLRYSEPPDWIQPIRHPLGALLLRERRFVEAEAVYREDLKDLPNNGWSLFGLAACLDGQGKAEQAANFRNQFENAWKGSDMQITSSCLCIPPTP